MYIVINWIELDLFSAKAKALSVSLNRNVKYFIINRVSCVEYVLMSKYALWQHIAWTRVQTLAKIKAALVGLIRHVNVWSVYMVITVWKVLISCVSILNWDSIKNLWTIWKKAIWYSCESLYDCRIMIARMTCKWECWTWDWTKRHQIGWSI